MISLARKKSAFGEAKGPKRPFPGHAFILLKKNFGFYREVLFDE
ncbi:hypothetical protein Lac3_30600 [Claveliimonas bilis]|nr:hypothetical protein Lac3_30600 [Claveliimonas bilis]